MDLPWLDGVQCPRTPKRIPSVLTVGWPWYARPRATMIGSGNAALLSPKKP